MSASPYRAIKLAEDLYRIERFMSVDDGYQPITIITEPSGKSYWMRPSPTARTYGASFSTGTIDECRDVVTRLVEFDRAQESVVEAPAEENIVNL